MADYFAVLNRTLSGFGEPKPELRGKLYERARMTIRRQLDSHMPPLDDAALSAEMNKLEEAIHKVENGFGPPNVDLPAIGDQNVPAAQRPEDQAAKSEQSSEEQPVENKPASEEKQQPPKEDETPSEAQAVPVAEPVLSRKEKRAAAKAERLKQKQEKADAAKAEAARVEAEKAEAAKVEAARLEAERLEAEKAAAAKAEKIKAEAAAQAKTKAESEAQSRAAEESKAAAKPAKDAPAEPSGNDKQDAPRDEAVDPMDEWAREFLNAQESGKPEVAEALAEIRAEQPDNGDTAEVDVDKRAASIAAAATAAAAKPATAKPAKAKAPDLPGFNAGQDESITIPPAPAAEETSSSGGGRKWLLVSLLLLLLIGAGALAANWENRSVIASKFGLDGLFGDTVTPTPVKTIKITPDPEPEPEPDPEPAPQAPAATEPDVPKSEDRLTGEGETEQPATPAPEAPATTDPAAEPETGDAAQPEAAPAEQTTQLPAADAGTTPAIAQSAILYEEGSSASQNSFDTGRIVWSVVQEQGGEGEGEIPAIRGRVEVPSRQLVLIMTIKRNTDRALPASHLIELVFAVPDDFSGGAIGEISRFVLKENEQGRGDALIGVPARISDGIFLIALNNLEAAQKTNEQLLRGRSWIDIPMAYRTGRRALITLEKGVPGDAVFKQVFEAWDALNNRP